MKKVALLAASLSLSSLAAAAEVRVYPGATVEDFAAWRRRHPQVTVAPGMHVKRYSTPDPLDKVVAFYAKIGSESGEEKRLRLQTGEEIRMRTFVLDGTDKDVRTSKLFVRIQRPYVDYITPEFRAEGVQELTAIEVISRD
jgi:hypothetical protein